MPLPHRTPPRRFRRVFPVLLTLLVCAAAATHAPSGRAVVGGEPLASQRFPWLVAIEQSTAVDPDTGAYDRQDCGGTLIAARLVLTAAHCVYSEHGRRLTPRSFSVVLSRRDLRSTEGEEIGVRAVRTPPGFNLQSLRGDVALLVLAHATLVPSANLRSARAPKRAHARATILGWGALDEEGHRSPVGRAATVAIWPDAACRRHRGDDAAFDAATMLCAGAWSGGRDACDGDSGDPLAVPTTAGWQPVGVVSFGDGCARAKHPGFYAWVQGPRLRGWISAQERRIASRRRPRMRPIGRRSARSAAAPRGSCPIATG